MTGIATELQPLLSVVAATLDRVGTLVEANAGFLRLFEPTRPVAMGTRVDRFFIQPKFASLIAAKPDNEGTSFSGLLTFGEYMGQTRSLRARIWVEGDHLRLLADYDIEQLEHVCATVLDINRDYAHAQLALAQANLALQQREAELAKTVAQLFQTNAELKQAGVQLLQTEKMASIGQLAAGVAHELNTPIGFINSNLGSLEHYLGDLFAIVDAYADAENTAPQDFTQLERAGALKREKDYEYLRSDTLQLLTESKDGLARVAKIAKDLKDFARAGEGEWQLVDLRAGIDATLNIVCTQLKYQCTVIKAYGDMPLTRCMPAHINQVFMNLLVNACQAMPETGTVTIRTGHHDDRVFVAVSDNGNGIAPENLNRIFEPFFTTKPVGKGTGLGLSLAYSIVRKHGGRIDVDSELGKGATFTVWLPIGSDTDESILSAAPTTSIDLAGTT